MAVKDSRQHIPDTFEYVFSQYRAGFVSIAQSYVLDRDVASDIVTDSFMYVWEHRNELAWDDNIKGYIYMAVRARCVSWLRSYQAAHRDDETGRRRNWRIESAIAVLDDDNVSGRIFSNEVHAIYRRELARMPRLTRDIFLASREYGRTYQEIAVMLDRHVKSIDNALQRVKHKLEKLIEERNG